MHHTNDVYQRVRIDPAQTKYSIRTVDIPLAACEFDTNQPRKHFDPRKLEELANSIEQHGLLQPVTVRRHPKKHGVFVIVAGERRFRAFKLLGHDVIPSVITTGKPEEISLIENLQREELSPLEEAEALARLKELYGYTQEELGRAVGKAHNTVAAMLRLNDLPKKIKKELPTSEVASRSLLVELATVKEPKEQLKLWNEAKERGLTVRDIRKRKRQAKAARTLSNHKRVLSLGKRFVSELEHFAQDNEPVTSGEYETLLEIFEGFGQMLENLADQKT